MNLIRLGAVVAVLAIGLVAACWISPGTLSTGAFSVGDTEYTTRLYVSDDCVYAQCSSANGRSTTLQVATLPDRTLNGNTVFDPATGQIVFSLDGTCVARYDTDSNRMIPSAVESQRQ